MAKKRVCKFPEKELKEIFPNMEKEDIDWAKSITKKQKGDGSSTLHTLGIWSWEYKEERKPLEKKLKQWYKCTKK